MALEKFDLRTLANMDDGRIREAFNQALARCESDCRDRPGVKKSRSVSITTTITPVLDEEGNLETCEVAFDISDKIPKRQSKTYAMRADGAGALFFNDVSPDNPYQRTIDEFDVDGDDDVVQMPSRKKGGE
jgi:hypothetical protein